MKTPLLRYTADDYNRARPNAPQPRSLWHALVMTCIAAGIAVTICAVLGAIGVLP